MSTTIRNALYSLHRGAYNKLEMKEEHGILSALYSMVPNLTRASDRALSVYMNARAEGFDMRFYDIELGQLRRRYSDRLDDEEREIMERELLRLREHLESVKPAGCPALAGFGDEPAGLLELVRMPMETEPRLEVGRLLLAPIERQLERVPPALIAVVDKEQAKLFAAILDDVRPLEQVHGVEVKRNRAGGTSAPSNQRKADNRTKANLEQVIDVIGHEVRSGAYARIFLAGPEEARAEMQRLMPPPLKRLLAGQLSAEIDSPRLQHELREQLLLTRSH